MAEEWEEVFLCCASFFLRLHFSKHICTFPSLMDGCNYDAERIFFSLKISCTLCHLPCDFFTQLKYICTNTCFSRKL